MFLQSCPVFTWFPNLGVLASRKHVLWLPRCIVDFRLPAIGTAPSWEMKHTRLAMGGRLPRVLLLRMHLRCAAAQQQHPPLFLVADCRRGHCSGCRCVETKLSAGPRRCRFTAAAAAGGRPYCW